MTSVAATSLSEPTIQQRPRAACPIDHTFLARYTFGNRALEIEVLQLFAHQAPDYLEALKSAATEKSWRDAAHTLKGSARAVGALQVAERAERAEALRASPDINAKACAVVLLDEALADALRHIASLADPAE